MAEAGKDDAEEPAQRTMTPFDDIYDQADPRAFFHELGAFGYRTPHHAQRIFRRLAALRLRAPGEAVLDLCCSYGINAALLNHEVTLDDLYAHYTSPQAAAMTTEELAEHDRSFFRARRRRDAVPVIGLDIAPNAIAYARAVGLLDDGFAENLEATPPTRDLLDAARSIQLITITGGASFLSRATFQPLLHSARTPPWVAAFVLRTGSYAPIAEYLADHGLTTETYTGRTFVQRRFTSAAEQQYAIDAVTAHGQDPDGKESAGHFHTALYLTRPAADLSTPPLGELAAQ
jgi:SAM-dependent methyltransferase